MTEPSAFHQDLEKCYRIEYGTATPPFSRRLRLWFEHFGLHCVAVYRMGRWADRLFGRNRLLGLLPVVAHRILQYHIRLFHHVDIEADIGPGFYIGHVGTIYVGPTTIGPNCSIHQNVTIGMGQTIEGSGIPVLGANVWVGAGSIVYGAITLGDGTTVSAGSILSRSTQPRALVAGNPARVILADFDNRNLFAPTQEPAAPSAGAESPES